MDSLTVADLRSELSDRGLPTTGLKKALLARLANYEESLSDDDDDAGSVGTAGPTEAEAEAEAAESEDDEGDDDDDSGSDVDEKMENLASMLTDMLDADDGEGDNYSSDDGTAHDGFDEDDDNAPAKGEGEGEDEFKNRDSRGLRTDVPRKTEAEVRSMYLWMFAKVLLLQAPFLATLLVLFFTYGVPDALLEKVGLAGYLPGHADLVATKFAFIHANQLGFVFLAWYLVYLTRVYLMLNANGARGPAMLDRPDQHIYKVMDANAPDDAPYVLMANTGAAGRFNRSMRAVANMDEGLPMYITGLLLSALCFGPCALLPALLTMYGRSTFANGYKESLGARGKGFFASVVAEHLTGSLVLIAALKGLIGPAFPF